jgi:hypothetical protein
MVDVGEDERVIKMDLKDVEWDVLDSFSNSVMAVQLLEYITLIGHNTVLCMKITGEKNLKTKTRFSIVSRMK